MSTTAGLITEQRERHTGWEEECVCAFLSQQSAKIKQLQRKTSKKTPTHSKLSENKKTENLNLKRGKSGHTDQESKARQKYKASVPVLGLREVGWEQCGHTQLGVALVAFPSSEIIAKLVLLYRYHDVGLKEEEKMGREEED